MKDISQVTCCVVDFGLFLPVAQRLSYDYKRVLYHNPCAIKGFPKLADSIIGDGIENIEVVEEFWSEIKEIDLFVFYDLGQTELQLFLEGIGKSVWGARAGNRLETNRKRFLDTLGEVGLEVPEFETINGLANLRIYLKDKTDKYVKISKYRGDMETTHWRDYESDSGWLDSLAVKFGPAQDLMPFLVFEPIDAETEVGADTYNINGRWPSLMIHGHEDKDKSYFGAVTPFADMPDCIQETMEAFSPVLARERYRAAWSMETRKGIFTDATTRGGLPSTATQLNTWKNFPDIVWHGANGELLEPEPAYLFSAECILSIKGRKDEWRRAKIKDELAQFIKLSGCCHIDGAVCFPADGNNDEDVGWLQAGGDTMEEAIERMHEHAGMLPDGLSAATDSLVGLLAKIKSGEDEEGAMFSNQEVPEPESALNV